MKHTLFNTLKYGLLGLFSLVILSSNTMQTASCSDGYFPLVDGKTMTYDSKNGKGKLTGSYTQKMSKAEGTIFSIHTVNLNTKGKEEFVNDYNVNCKDGEITIDMKSILSSFDQLTKMEDVEMDITSTDKISFPNNLTTESKLTGGKIVVKAENMGITLFSLTAIVSDRKVETLDSKITVKAGTFTCAKVSSIIRTQMMVKTIEQNTVDYYAKGVGLVKSEVYNMKNGKLLYSSELTDYSK